MRGLSVAELAERCRLPAALLAAALEDEQRLGRAMCLGGRWSLTAAGEREVGPTFRAIDLTRRQTTQGGLSWQL